MTNMTPEDLAAIIVLCYIVAGVAAYAARVLIRRRARRA